MMLCHEMGHTATGLQDVDQTDSVMYYSISGPTVLDSELNQDTLNCTRALYSTSLIYHRWQATRRTPTRPTRYPTTRQPTTRQPTPR